MRRIVLNVTTMLLTFALGFGIHSFISQRQVDDTPPVEVLRVGPITTQAQLFAPVAPIPPASSAKPETILVLDYDPEEFTPWAIFYVMGHKPEEFADLDSIELGLYRDVDHQSGYLGLNTCDPGVTCDSAPGTFALVSEERLFFATSQMPNTGFEYWFDGRFLRTDFDTVEGKQVAVLRGTLTKTKHGRKIAEHTFTFRMEHLGC